MRWPRWRRRGGSRPSPDAQAAMEQADRAMADTDRLIEHVGNVTARAHEVADRSERVSDRNHLAEAVWDVMRRGVGRA